jgi:hypothetical protein
MYTISTSFLPRLGILAQPMLPILPILPKKITFFAQMLRNLMKNENKRPERPTPFACQCSGLTGLNEIEGDVPPGAALRFAPGCNIAGFQPFCLSLCF